jgi:hypothetical protein
MQKTSSIIVLGLIGFGLSNVAAATEEEWVRALEIPCHPLVTAAECRVHRDRLASLAEGPEKQHYMAQHLAMVEDRVHACGCTLAHNTVGSLERR